MDPAIRSRLSHFEDCSQQHLQRISLLIPQAEQQFLFCRTQLPLRPPPALTLTNVALSNFALEVSSLIRTAKNLMQLDKFFETQSNQRQELTQIFVNVILTMKKTVRFSMVRSSFIQIAGNARYSLPTLSLCSFFRRPFQLAVQAR